TPADFAPGECAWTSRDIPPQFVPHLWRGGQRAGEENIRRLQFAVRHDTPALLVLDAFFAIAPVFQCAASLTQTQKEYRPQNTLKGASRDGPKDLASVRALRHARLHHLRIAPAGGSEVSAPGLGGLQPISTRAQSCLTFRAHRQGGPGPGARVEFSQSRC